MDDLWQQFHRLPKAIRDAVATKKALAAVERLEQANPGLDLADLVLRLMVKEFSVTELPKKLQDEAKLSKDKSEAVSEQLKKEVLADVADYLGIQTVKPEPQPVAPVTKISAAQLTKKPDAVVTKPPTPGLPPPPPKQPAPVSRGLGMPPSNLPTPPAKPPVSTAPVGLGMPKPSTTPTPAIPPSAPAGLGKPPLTTTPPPKPSSIPTPWTQKPAPFPAAPVAPIPKPAVLIPAVKPELNEAPPIPAIAAAPKSTSPIAPTQEYSEEETVEIGKQAERLKNLKGATVSDFDEMAKRILDQHHLAWPDELITRRAEAIAKARLKEIRNTAQTEKILTQEPKLGGLGLDPELAKQLATDLEKEAGKLKARGMVRPPEPVAPPPPVVTPPVQQAKPLGQPPLLRTIPPSGLPPTQPLPVNVTEQPRMSRPIKRPADIPIPSSNAVHVPEAVPPKAPTVMQRPRQQDRPTVSDITRPSKAYGPGEEMKSLTLTEWRRLGQGAAESARVILEKFRNLQRESFVLWTAALAGWRQSEVYQLYLDMGRQSLDQGISIQEVIAVRSRNGQTYLSEHEFFTVTDLNRMLQH